MCVVVVVDVFVAFGVVPCAVGGVVRGPVFAEAGDGEVDFVGVKAGGGFFGREEGFETYCLPGN